MFEASVEGLFGERSACLGLLLEERAALRRACSDKLGADVALGISFLFIVQAYGRMSRS